MGPFAEHLQRLNASHLLRRLRTVEAVSPVAIRVEGRLCVNFASNDYLGLARHPAVIDAAAQALLREGVGAGAARLLAGTLPSHSQLETAIARFKGTEASLVFGSGYLANTGLIPALIGKGGLILADRLIHASLFDGCHLSGADLRIFGHNDVEQIGTLLSRRSASRPTLIVTEGVFSMDGDLAALPAICDLADRYEAVLYVDDAHGTGVMGPQGRGTSEHFGVAARLPFHVGTLGKALGTSGGYIAGPSDTVAYCLNVARTFLFSTAPPPAIAAATEAAIHIIDQDPDRRTRLWDNRRYMVDGLAQLDYRTTATQSPIVPILIGSAKRACAVSERLLDAGIYAPAIRPPTVPPGSSRIRLTISSEHSRDDIDHLLLALRNACRDTPAS